MVKSVRSVAKWKDLNDLPQWSYRAGIISVNIVETINHDVVLQHSLPWTERHRRTGTGSVAETPGESFATPMSPYQLQHISCAYSGSGVRSIFTPENHSPSHRIGPAHLGSNPLEEDPLVNFVLTEIDIEVWVVCNQGIETYYVIAIL
jgi:hypothetical protein